MLRCVLEMLCARIHASIWGLPGPPHDSGYIGIIGSRYSNCRQWRARATRQVAHISSPPRRRVPTLVDVEVLGPEERANLHLYLLAPAAAYAAAARGRCPRRILRRGGRRDAGRRCGRLRCAALRLCGAVREGIVQNDNLCRRGGGSRGGEWVNGWIITVRHGHVMLMMYGRGLAYMVVADVCTNNDKNCFSSKKTRLGSRLLAVLTHVSFVWSFVWLCFGCLMLQRCLTHCSDGDKQKGHSPPTLSRAGLTLSLPLSPSPCPRTHAMAQTRI